MQNTPPVNLPRTGFIRLRQMSPGIIPAGSTTIWRWVKAGKFPKPVKLSSGMTAWRCAEVHEWMEARK